MFIVFDGVDGTGKSTQLKMLVNWLIEHKVDFLQLREPGGSPNSENIRKVFIKNKTEPITQLLLVAAARHENMKLLEENSNRLIISDRFIDSTYAYQGLYLKSEIIDTVMDISVTKYPDYTFLFLYQYKKKYNNHFDELAIKRIEDIRGKFLERQNHNPEKYFIIPEGTTYKTHVLIKNKIKELLNLNID